MVEALRVLKSSASPKQEQQVEFARIMKEVEGEIQAQVAGEFDQIHSVDRALDVGSLSRILSPLKLRAELSETLQDAVERYRVELSES